MKIDNIPIISIGDIRSFAVTRKVLVDSDAALVMDKRRGVVEGLIIAPRCIESVGVDSPPAVAVADIQNYNAVRAEFDAGHDAVLIRNLRSGRTEGLIIAPRRIEAVVRQMASVSIGGGDEY
jgi:hypothetical protein